MAKSNGIQTRVRVDTSTGGLYDISGDVTNLDWALPRTVQDVTGVNQAAMARILLLADFSGTINGIWNPGGADTSTAHEVFRTIPSTDVTRTLQITIGSSGAVSTDPQLVGDTVSATAAIGIEVLLTDYPLTRAQSGELTFAVPFLLQDGRAPLWSVSSA